MDAASQVASVRFNAYEIVSLCNATLCLYERLLTIGDEADLVWPSKWGAATILYYFSHYSVVPELALQLTFVFGRVDNWVCGMISGYLGFSVGLGIMLGQGIIVLRTQAIWNGSQRIKWCLVMFVVFACILIGYLCTQWAIETRVVSRGNLDPELRRRNILSSYHTGLSVGWILFYCDEAALICLTLIKYCQHRAALCLEDTAYPRHDTPKLTNLLFRDSFTYFSIVLAFAAGNIALTISAPLEYRLGLFCTERVVYTCLTCRIILGLRAGAQTPVAITVISIEA